MGFDPNSKIDLFMMIEPPADREPEPASSSKSQIAVDSDPYVAAADLMMRSLTGVYAAGSTHRRDAERMTCWRLTMQQSGLWRETHEHDYQEWRKTEIAFWQEFCAETVGLDKEYLRKLFRFEWTTKTGCQCSEEVVRITRAELGIEV